MAEDKEFTIHEMKMLNAIINSTALGSMKSFRHGQFEKIIRHAGFANVKVDDISKNTAASIGRYWKYAVIPYHLIKPFGLQEKFPNITVAIEWYNMAKKGLIKYKIFTAEK